MSPSAPERWFNLPPGWARVSRTRPLRSATSSQATCTKWARVCASLRSNQDNPDRWLAQHHLTYWIAYQPHSHLVWFELARNGILVTAAALAVLAAVWWLRTHLAE